MDERARVSRFTGAPSRRLCALACAAALAACGAPEARRPAPASAGAFTELARDVAQWRDLPFDQPLHLELPADPLDAANIPPAPLAQFESAYKAIGLLPNTLDFAAALADYRKLNRMIAYDGGKNLVLVSAAAARLGAPLASSRPAPARELAAALGVVRALQERRFHWREKILASGSADRRIALRAIAGGDALLAAVSRALAEKPRAAQLALTVAIGAEVDRLARDLPDFLRRRAVFPYREGGQFVYWAFASSGWKGVDALYADPPRSAAQVLHPEKFFLRREAPLHFFPLALLRRLRAQSRVEDALGELALIALLEEELGANAAADTAAGWRGDQLFFFPRDGEFDLFWFSAWRDESAAEKFLAGYRGVLESRRRLRFERVAQTKDVALLGAARDGGAWLLQRRGELVLGARSESAQRITELAQDAWRDLEVDAAPAAVDFESARRAGLSLR